jgi:hypothetical protein
MFDQDMNYWQMVGTAFGLLLIFFLYISFISIKELVSFNKFNKEKKLLKSILKKL